MNAIYLANHTGSFAEKVEALTRLWCNLSVEQVFRVDGRSLLVHLGRWMLHLTLLGGRRNVRELRGLVDTQPLSELLHHELGSADGSLPGIAENVRAGRLSSVAITTTHYASGQTITWCQGRVVRDWDRPQRRSVRADLQVDHVLASAALPLFFPAVQIGGRWYGDGGIRLHSPLAPATHLGASRIIAVSTSPIGTDSEFRVEGIDRYPSPAQVLGVLYSSIFLDLLGQDAVHLKRINRLLEGRPDAAQLGLRPVELLMLRPTQSLGMLAKLHEPQLPSLFRFLMRRLGTQNADRHELLSLLMFQGDYLARIIELGESDADARASEITRMLEAAGVA
jgi:NTE family protein